MELVITILVGATVFSIMLLVKHLTKNRGYLEQQNIPVAKPFGFFGSPPYALHKLLLHEAWADMFKKYGKTFGRYDGICPVIMTIDPEVLKNVLVKNFDSFTDIFDVQVRLI